MFQTMSGTAHKNSTFGQKLSLNFLETESHDPFTPRKSTFNFPDMKVCAPQLVCPSELRLRVGGCCTKASEVAFIRVATSQVRLWTSNQRSLSEAKYSSLAAESGAGDQREKQKSLGLRGLAGWLAGWARFVPLF